MPEVSRIGDLINTGHDCDNTAPIYTGSDNVITEGQKTATMTSEIEPHQYGPGCLPHSAEVNTGSSSVFVNDLPIARIGDSADLGVIIEGAATVLAGG